MTAGVSRKPGAPLHYVGVAAKLGFLALVGAYLAYLVGINLFMSTGLFDMVINADPRTLDIHFDRGWSVRPGRVHASNLSVRSRDGSLEWILHINEVQFDISFLALARQRFQVSNVHGVGGSFRLRSRLDPSEVTPARLAGIPPIDGFPAVPIRPFQQCAASEWDDSRYHLWTIQLESVRADSVREIWVDRYRIDGDFSTTGRFYLKPVRAVEIGPLHTDFGDNRLSVDGNSWVEGVAGTADFKVPRFDPRTGGGSAFFQRMSLAVESHGGSLPDLGRLPIPMPPDVALRGGVELQHGKVRVDGGLLTPGSGAEAVGPRVVVEDGEHRVSSALAASLVVGEHDERRASRPWRGARAWSAKARRSWSRRASTSPGRGTVLWGRAEARTCTSSSTSPDVEMPDVRVLASYIPSSSRVMLMGGRAHGTVSGEVWADSGRATGRASMQATDLDVRVGDVHVTGVMGARASVASLDWRTGDIDRPEGSVTIDSRVEVAPQRAAGTKDLEADVRAVALTKSYDPRDRTLDVSGSGVRLGNMIVDGEPAGSTHGAAWLDQAKVRLDRPALDGHAALDVTDATPLFAGVREHIPGPFRGLLDIPRLVASTRLSVNERRVELRDMQAAGGRLNVYGVFAAGHSDRLGAFVVEGGPVSIGLRVDPAGAHVHFFGLSGWLEQEKENVSDRFGSPY